MALTDIPSWLWLSALFLFGLLFGSFGNVVIWRFPRGENLSHPGSHCPSCDTPIAWYDNVPVLSWMALGAKCRACHEPISPRYPAVELLSGILWLLAGVKFGLSLTTIFCVVFFYLLMLLAFIDWDTMHLPNTLVGLLFVVGMLGAGLSQLTGLPAVPLLAMGGGWLAQPLVSALVGAVLSGGILLAVGVVYSLIRKTQGFGMGDAKLLGTIGVFLGVYGLLAAFIATLLGAVYGVISARRSEEGGKHKFPFGPFIVAGAVLTTLAGQAIWAWYAGLLG
jgi:leader peptidase (prepilin peptidase)/N-methyltransferase